MLRPGVGILGCFTDAHRWRCHAAVLRGHSIRKHGRFAEVRTKPVTAEAGKVLQILVKSD